MGWSTNTALLTRTPYWASWWESVSASGSLVKFRVPGIYNRGNRDASQIVRSSGFWKETLEETNRKAHGSLAVRCAASSRLISGGPNNWEGHHRHVLRSHAGLVFHLALEASPSLFICVEQLNRASVSAFQQTEATRLKSLFHHPLSSRNLHLPLDVIEQL